MLEEHKTGIHRIYMMIIIITVVATTGLSIAGMTYGDDGREAAMTQTTQRTEEDEGRTGIETDAQDTAADMDANRTDKDENITDTDANGENQGDVKLNQTVALGFSLTTANAASRRYTSAWISGESYSPPEGEEYPYKIYVNRAAICVTVYGMDAQGAYTIPVRAMACSVGRNRRETPLGSFATSDMYLWRQMVDGTYSQYAVRIAGSIMFHAVPCFTESKDDIETEEFNKLGNNASLGCIRLCVADAKWIYDNTAPGTEVVIYDDEKNPGPLGKPEMVRIPENSACRHWDPTDPDVHNPWNQLAVAQTAVQTLTVQAGTTVTKSQLQSVCQARDRFGSDITETLEVIEVYHHYDPDVLLLRICFTDALGQVVQTSLRIVVEDSASQTE